MPFRNQVSNPISSCLPLTVFSSTETLSYKCKYTAGTIECSAVNITHNSKSTF